MTDATLTRSEMLKSQGRLLVALMLRDIKTRFGGSELGFLIAIAWPLTHILALILIYYYAGRTAPYGNSTALWFATGIVPFMASSYMSRFICMGIVLNKPLFTLPIVKITDVLFARAIVEALSASLIVLILFVIFWVYDIDFAPRDIVQASLALLSMLYLGLGLGVINAIIAGAVPFWMTGYQLLLIPLWVASGVLFVPDALPEVARNALSYNPFLQGIEWTRSAYYDGYGTSVLDKTYLISFSTISLGLGLIFERIFRGKMLI
jgi:capsular polysaccharide transport system permease protein